jgi:hypothetical protein
VALGATGVTPAPASAPTAPVNDNYISSLELNAPGKKLNRTDTLKDLRDTTAATVQSDIFSPPSSGGPAENTTCHGVSYGNTVWYDFYPDRDGTIRIRTSGYDNVIALYRFSRSTLLPQANPQCVHQSSSPFEELDANVKQGLSYTIQIGGVGGVGGPLQFLFDFFAPPHRLTAQSTLKARATSTGIQLLGLSVSSSRSAQVRVSCGGACRPETMHGRATETFPDLNGVQMQAGSQLQIRVSAPEAIGAYIQYNILRGNFTKLTRCMEPGSRKPRRKCH